MNFEFLRSNNFIKVDEREFCEVMCYFRNYAFAPFTKPEYDAKNHELFITYQLKREHWNVVYGEMAENTTRVIGYKNEDEYYLWGLVVGLPGMYHVAA